MEAAEAGLEAAAFAVDSAEAVEEEVVAEETAAEGAEGAEGAEDAAAGSVAAAEHPVWGTRGEHLEALEGWAAKGVAPLEASLVGEATVAAPAGQVKWAAAVGSVDLADSEGREVGLEKRREEAALAGEFQAGEAMGLAGEAAGVAVDEWEGSTAVAEAGFEVVARMDLEATAKAVRREEPLVAGEDMGVEMEVEMVSDMQEE